MEYDGNVLPDCVQGCNGFDTITTDTTPDQFCTWLNNIVLEYEPQSETIVWNSSCDVSACTDA